MRVVVVLGRVVVGIAGGCISQDASSAQTSIADDPDVRSRWSFHERTYPSKMHSLTCPAGVTTTETFVFGSKVPSPTYRRSPADVRFTGSRRTSDPGPSARSSTSKFWIAA